MKNGLHFIIGLIFLFAALPTQAQTFISDRQAQAEFYQQFNLQTETQYDSLATVLFGTDFLGTSNNTSTPQTYKTAQTNTLSHQVYGWQPYWIGEGVYNAYDFSLLSTLSYFSYEVEPTTGNYSDIHNWKTTNAITKAQAAGVKVELCVSNFGASNNATFLSSTNAQNTLIDNLIELLNYRNADGVNIDFEGIASAQRNDFTNFMQRLNTRLNNERPGTNISMALYAVDWNSVFDIPSLHNLVDQFIIMGYDYHYRSSDKAGPVAPLYGSSTWGNLSLNNSINTYLDKGVSTNKLLLAVPYYGYEWETTSSAVGASTVGSGTSRTYNYIQDNYSNQVYRWDDNSLSPYYSFVAGGQQLQCWYEDEMSLGERYDLVRSKGLAGVGIWALGYDHGYTDLWELLAEKFADGTVPPNSDYTCGETLYDSGGEQGSYQNGEDYELTLSNPNNGLIALDFKEFDLEQNYDFLYVYDGASTNATNIATLTGNVLPTRIVSSGSKLTLRFVSDNATIAGGFELVWQCANASDNPTTNPNNNGNPDVFPEPEEEPVFCAGKTSITSIGSSNKGSYEVNFKDEACDGANLLQGYYQVLYGNTNDWEANTQNGFFNDDFKAQTLRTSWTSASGNWSIDKATGALEQSDYLNSNTNLHHALEQDSLQNYLYHWKAKIGGAGNDRRAGLHFFASSPDAENRGSSYFVFFRVDDNEVHIYKVLNDEFTLVSNEPCVVNADVLYDYKVSYNPTNGTIAAYQNNELVSSWTDPNPLQSGKYLSLRTADCSTHYDFVKTYKARAASVEVSIGTAANNDVVSGSGNITTSFLIASIANFTDYTWSNIATKTSLDLNIIPTAKPMLVSNLNVYPNPVNTYSGNLTLQFDAKETVNTQIILTDLWGRTISNNTYDAAAGSNNYVLTLPNLIAGTYVAALITEGGCIGQQILVVE